MSRERILDAAVRRIAADGIDDVRIARIAMDAGVSTALVHYHFATREALLAEALEHSFERAGQTRRSETGEGLRNMIEQCLPLPGEQEQDWVLWVELWLRAVRHPELRPTAAQLYRRMHEWFKTAIEEELPDADADVTAHRLLALVDGYGIRALLGDPEMPVERAREEIWAALAPIPALSERGVQNTRIRDVAERAGTSAPGVLHWFPSKDALLAEALTFSDDRFYASLSDELAAYDTATDRLTRLIEMWPAEGDGETVLWMELWVRALRDPKLAKTREQLDRRWREALADVIREGQVSGEFGAGDADDLALVLGAVMDGFAIQLTLGDPAVTTEAVRRHCLDLAMRGVEHDDGTVEPA